MQELIDNLISKVGLTPDQAGKTIETIKDYIIQKFPMLEGALENMFGKPAEGAATTGTTDVAEEAFDSIKEKLGGFFSGK